MHLYTPLSSKSQYLPVYGLSVADSLVTMEVSTMIGFFLLIALVLYANGNDLFRAFAG